ncbi:MAG: PAS domain-containing protein [Candidatus Devosia phytovorans]|uniref:Blue-light-activated histidine kinase n=1 Tax=Candidatus Devosia phytovorans TaxID=3121372 RepID=A0AAJ5VSS5_9HYPH|nr:PAS domain-containing protein [Devosia sp.]WEK02719.1 MAG: PAS domain-containing protein [Devosia sp.]
MPKSLFPAASPEARERLERDPTLKLINEFDWSSHPLGPIPGWPESLRGSVRLMMSTATPMVMLIGTEGYLVYNNAYAVFAGGRHPEIFGMPAARAWPEIADFNRGNIERGLRNESWSLTDQELALNRNGQPEPVWMDLRYSAVVGEDGQSMGTLCIVHETTGRMLAQKALARSEERLSLALNGSSLVGTWDWDVAANIVTSDDKFAAMFNLDSLKAGLGVPIEEFLAAIHPDDVTRVGNEIAAVLKDGSPYRSEYRLVDQQGATHYVSASGRPRLDSNGVATRFPGVIVDITEQRHISDALAESELRFRTLADTMPQMVWSTLPDGYHDYYNARWYEFTGVPQGSTDGEGWNDMFHPEDQDRAWKAWRHSLATGEPYQIEYRLKHHTGAYRWTLGLALPIRDAEGQILRWIGTCTDIHETKQVTEERELVAQELSHRIKNIFAVLTSIISLSARSKSDEVKAFSTELRQRIYALGEAHDFVRPHSHVSRPPENQGSLKSLIDRLMQPYGNEEGSRILFDGDDAQIDDGAATPLALLFHELGTNSAKYGALSLEAGRVGLTGSQSDDRYRLSWKEIGGPAIEREGELSGFGSRLITLSVEGQMRGNLQRLWETDGLRVEIDLPLDTLRRSGKLQS